MILFKKTSFNYTQAQTTYKQLIKQHKRKDLLINYIDNGQQQTIGI